MTSKPAVTTSPEPVTTSPVAALYPGYFALVMATGIIAVALSQQEIDGLSSRWTRSATAAATG